MTSLFTSPAAGRTPDFSYAHRRSQVTLQLSDRTGAPAANQDVQVRQTDHAFGFGCIGFELVDHINGQSQDPEYDDELAHRWLEVFNWATLPFYWGRFEPQRGQSQTDYVMAGARWFAERRVRVKGHPLVWHTVCAPWLLQLDNAEIERLLRARIRREVADFSGVIDMWDAINEAVIMPVFSAEDNGVTRIAHQLGRIEMVRLAFEEARAANPAATLLLNDFDMTTGYEALIEGVLEAGIQIDRLGLQSHMHQGAWSEERYWDVLERFSRFNIPIHFTETTILSGDLMPAHVRDLNDWQVEQWPSTPEGEERQAQEVEAHYRRLFAHPSVEAATYWGLPDRAMWLNAPGGLLRADGSPKPAYDRLRALVKGEWWLQPTTLHTDDDGRATFTGYLGDYEVTTAGRTAELALTTPGEQQLNLTI